MRVLLSTAILAAAATGCDVEQLGSSQQAIIGGTYTSGDPAVVALLQHDQAGDVVGFCSGVLVSPHVVVTAAHCLHEVPAFSAYFGSEPFAFIDAAGLGTIAAVDVLIHPQFEYTGRPMYEEFDVGAIALEEPAPVPFIPLQRAPLDAEVGGELRLVGFGRTGMGVENQGVKRQVRTPLGRIDELRTYFGTAGASTCGGDSGSPQLLEIAGGEVVVSVNSGGELLDCSGASVGFRMDAFAASLLDPFIREHDTPACTADGLCALGCDDPDCAAACPAGEDCSPACSPDDPTCSSDDPTCAPGDPACPPSGGDGGCAATSGARGLPTWMFLLVVVLVARTTTRARCS